MSPPSICRVNVTAASSLLLLLIVGLLWVGASDSSAKQVSTRVLDRQFNFAPPAAPVALSAVSAIVVDARTGDRFYSLRSRSGRYPASTVKLMTALVAIDHLSLDQKIRSSGYRAAPVESAIQLGIGERMTVRDLLYALLLESANDAADTLALRTFGSRKRFVAAMNSRAKRLGMTGTSYGNPIGLDQPRSATTARDLAVVGRAVLANPVLSKIVGTSARRLRSGDHTRGVVNRNGLVRRYRWVDGVKTGHTSRAKHILVAAGHRADRSFVTVAMGAPSVAARDRDSFELLRFARGHYRQVTAVKADRAISRVPVQYQADSAAVVPRRTVRVGVRSGERLVVRASLPEELSGPIPANSKVGSATITRNSKLVSRVDLVTRVSVPAPTVVQEFSEKVVLALTICAVSAMLLLVCLLLLSLGKSFRSGNEHEMGTSENDHHSHTECRDCQDGRGAKFSTR